MTLQTEQLFAQSDSISAAVNTNMANQMAECKKNTAKVWDSKLNRCVGKQQAIDTRNEAKACDALTDVTAKQNCHLKIAEKNTGLNSDTGSLYTGNSGSMLINGAATIYGAYSVLGWFNSTAKTKGENSACMSKKILGITGAAGIASDIYLKMKAKKTVKVLEGKFMLDKKNTAYEAQIKALEYLKVEQETVAEIAGMEKKRNMLLMVGYGLATGWAVYELTPFGANPDCVPKKDDDTKKEPDKSPAADPAQDSRQKFMDSIAPGSQG